MATTPPASSTPLFPSMASEQHRQTMELFRRVSELPSEDREAALREADPAVAAEVWAMLAADGATGPLDHPSALPGVCSESGGGAGALLGELPRRIGPYGVLGELGHGATGIVLEAQRDRPRKRVALKVLRLAAAPEAVRRRFEHEAEILARLRHPGIAQVFEAGVHEDGGSPLVWFALELVPGGRAITDHCRERDLPLRDRIALFARVCDAVNYAHSRGVIHRDLKPANILVDAEGDPKVIDFGIARVVDPAATVLTMQLSPGAVLGTAAYMSPEQWSGRAQDVDARTDVYSLGVILYELLVGRPPFDLRGLGIAEAMQVVLRSAPDEPASLAPRLRGDLNAIILKAMATDRQRRYPWAEALAQDLRDHLAGQPITARPPGRWQRMAGWIGRRPIASTVAACAAIAMISLAATFVAVSVLAMRPARIVVDPLQQSASLQSRAGHNLHVWEDVPKGIASAELVRRPREIGGGRVALITRSVYSTDPELAGHVAMYDISRPDEPIWSTCDAPLTTPAGYEERLEIKLDGGLTLVEDIFGDVPGREIATAQGLWPYSPVCIRIFDLAGRELYVAWHDGGVSDMQWLPDRGQLVIAGLASETRWDERGLSWPGGAYPSVVMALAPELGHIGRPWTLERDRLRDPTVRWCKWLGPADELEAIAPYELRLGSPSRPTADHLLVATAHLWRSEHLAADLMFGIDSAGAEIRRWTSDAYKAEVRAGRLPEPGVFRLLDITELPPKVGASGAR